jgi:hypothetical protein
MTYTLFVNYQAFCDASFMPINLFNKVEYLTHELNDPEL